MSTKKVRRTVKKSIKKVTAAMKNKIVGLRMKGLSYQKIADKIGFSSETVRYWIKKLSN